MIYAGIGSRQTPPDVCDFFKRLAARLEKVHGAVLRSGGAAGADSAFFAGVTDVRNAEIYLPWPNFNGVREISGGDNTTYCNAHALAATFHPAWERCNDTARKFHARNCYQILGKNLKTPADFVICWTPDGKVTGGTGQALRMAQHYDIPIVNYGDPNTTSELLATVVNQAAANQGEAA